MKGRPKVAVIDGYIDDPAALGVPPYISPMIRAVAGAARDAGADVEYVTVDMIRNGHPMRTCPWSSPGTPSPGSISVPCPCP